MTTFVPASLRRDVIDVVLGAESRRIPQTACLPSALNDIKNIEYIPVLVDAPIGWLCRTLYRLIGGLDNVSDKLSDIVVLIDKVWCVVCRQSCCQRVTPRNGSVVST